MDIDTLLNFLGIYVFLLIFFYSVVAVYSYAYYVHKTQASIELRNQFKSTLKAPAKWMFIGQKTFVEFILLYRPTSSKNLEEFFQKTSLFEIQVSRIVGSILALFITLFPTLGIYFVPEKHLMIQYIVNLLIQVATLVESWRFGHTLIPLSQNTSPTINS